MPPRIVGNDTALAACGTEPSDAPHVWTVLLDDPSCSRSEHDVVRPASAGAAQQDLELKEDTCSLGSEVF
ncbi:hypothetical protein B296_00015715 [Ensete ventricosum]|uniref:Uncharacterized protein n=1 Tax=Ensete ventricosum TaxID=4639 RepID=A0A427A572_ENSVE|nr:hypothetical protein B296_00015715 [Ensete ventricosum]